MKTAAGTMTRIQTKLARYREMTGRRPGFGMGAAVPRGRIVSSDRQRKARDTSGGQQRHIKIDSIGARQCTSARSGGTQQATHNGANMFFGGQPRPVVMLWNGSSTHAQNKATCSAGPPPRPEPAEHASHRSNTQENIPHRWIAASDRTLGK